MNEKMLPHSLDAEQGVLGSILIDGEGALLVADFLQPEDFYYEKHQTIYRAMVHLIERHEAPDIITVSDTLEHQGKLEQVGGTAYLASLVSIVPTSQNVESYGRRVAAAGLNRRIVRAAGEMARLGYEEADDALSRSEEMVYGLGNRSIASEVTSAGSLFADFFNTLSSLPDGGSIVGIPSGLYALDNMTRGFQKSDLILLAARPAMGKTSLCMSVARNAAMKYGCGVLVFSCEMSKLQLVQRLVAMEAEVNVQRLFTKQLSDEELNRVTAIGHTIDAAPLWIDDTPGLTIAAMRSKIRRMLAEHQIDLIIVDYLQLMQATIDGKRIKERFQEVSEVARSLKNVAREFNLPILALAQLSRAVEGRADKIPQLSDLRESGELEQAADIVMFIHREDYYAGYDKQTGESRAARPGTADIIIAKHRNGPIGEVTVGFEAAQTKFYNIEETR